MVLNHEEAGTPPARFAERFLYQTSEVDVFTYYGERTKHVSTDQNGIQCFVNKPRPRPFTSEFSITDGHDSVSFREPFATINRHLRASSVSSGELSTFMQSIWNNDNNAATEVRINLQGHTSTDSTSDHASRHLFTYVNETLDFSIPTYATLIKVLDNYNHVVGISEHSNSHETSEINAFLNALSQTTVIKKAHEFLHTKSYVGAAWSDFSHLLWQVWFEMYSRHGHTVDSSGFEHVFVGETDSHGVVGFHNWIQFYLQEKKGNLNYMGYIFSHKPNMLGTHFTWLSKTKGIGSFMYGTSPEFDIAMYTVCFLTRRNQPCTFTIDGHSMKIQTYDLYYNNGHHIGSAYVG